MFKKMLDFFRKRKLSAATVAVPNEEAEGLRRSQDVLRLCKLFQEDVSVRRGMSEKTGKYLARLDTHRAAYARIVEERHLQPPPGSMTIDRGGKAVETAFILCASDLELISLYALHANSNACPQYIIGDMIERVVKPVLFPGLPTWSVKVVE